MSRLKPDVSKGYPRLIARSSPKSASSSALPSEMMRKMRSYPQLGVNGMGGSSSSSDGEGRRTRGPRKNLKVNVSDSLDYPMGLTWHARHDSAEAFFVAMDWPHYRVRCAAMIDAGRDTGACIIASALSGVASAGAGPTAQP